MKTIYTILLTTIMLTSCEIEPKPTAAKEEAAIAVESNLIKLTNHTNK